jgi:hypothetical protein
LEQLDSAANLLLTVADGDLPGFCGISPDEAKELLRAVHPLVDEQRQARVKSLRARKPGAALADPKWEQSCARGCHCGVYAEILDSIGDERLSAADRKSRDRMMSQASSLGARERSACAQKATWFCKSPLLSKLRMDAKRLN